MSKIVTQGSKKGEYKILKDDDSDFMKRFLDNFKHKLGPPAEEIIVEDHNTVEDERQRLGDAEKQEKELEA